MGISENEEADEGEDRESSRTGGDEHAWPRWEHRARSPRSRWWRELTPEEQAEEAGEASSEWAERVARYRPAWWPENEPWPPRRRPWRVRSRRPFFRRLGCLFLVFNLVGAAFFVAVIIMLLNILRL